MPFLEDHAPGRMSGRAIDLALTGLEHRAVRHTGRGDVDVDVRQHPRVSGWTSVAITSDMAASSSMVGLRTSCHLLGHGRLG